MKKAKVKKEVEKMEENKPDRLDKCYYWHIITLATMKYKLRNLMKGVR